MIKKYNLWLKRKIQPEVEAPSLKPQASSFKQRLTMVQGSCRMYIERYIMNDEQLKRIADALEEILRMVKTDQERAEEARIHYKMEEEQTK
jgi:hypothetical protein